MPAPYLANLGRMTSAARVKWHPGLAKPTGAWRGSVLLPATDEAGARAVAEAVQTGILDAAIPSVESPRGFLTVSIGVATREPAAGQSQADLIRNADIALYAAKAEGRDRTVCDPPAVAALHEVFSASRVA